MTDKLCHCSESPQQGTSPGCPAIADAMGNANTPCHISALWLLAWVFWAKYGLKMEDEYVHVFEEFSTDGQRHCFYLELRSPGCQVCCQGWASLAVFLVRCVILIFSQVHDFLQVILPVIFFRRAGCFRGHWGCFRWHWRWMVCYVLRVTQGITCIPLTFCDCFRSDHPDCPSQCCFLKIPFEEYV